MAYPHLTIPPLSPQQISHFWQNVRKYKPNECWEWTGCRNKDGYGAFGFDYVVFKAHRVAWTIANGPIPTGLCVCHHCDNPPCVNPAHLFLGTQTTNIADMDAKGRRNPASGERNGSHKYPELRRGKRNGRAKYTEQDIRDIRAEYVAGSTQRALARKWGTGKTTISHIVRRETWAHVA